MLRDIGFGLSYKLFYHLTVGINQQEEQLLAHYHNLTNNHFCISICNNINSLKAKVAII